MIKRRLFVLVLAAALCLSPICGAFTSFAEEDEPPAEQNTVRHAAYGFNDDFDLMLDEGNAYPLSTSLFGREPEIIEGYRGAGIKGFISFPNVLFEELNELSVGFWANFTAEEAFAATNLFSAVGTKGESVELSLSAVGKRSKLTVRLSDGKNSVSCTSDFTPLVGEEAVWNHLAFTYKTAGTVSLLTLYVNGESVDFSTKSVDLSGMKCSAAYLADFAVDEVYVSNFALERDKVQNMMKLSASNFYAMQQRELISSGVVTTDTGENTDDPITVDRYDYSWAAYLFEDSFAGGTDLHNNDNPCTVDYNGCSGINSANLKEKFGYALIRRDSFASSAYLSLPLRLIRYQPAFTFACWIYREGGAKPNQESVFTLDGGGTLRFAPYASEVDGTATAFVEYTDRTGRVVHRDLPEDLPDPRGNWVHYALTVDGTGLITVYVDAAPVATFPSEISPALLEYTSAQVLTDATADSPTRTALDEVYVAPKALSAAELRKLRFYGAQRYTSEVLPDPGGTGVDPTDPYAPDAVDMEQDAYTQRATIANGFIGTTFDSRVEMGADWNNAAKATVTGGQLTKGIAAYALSLDGKTSFLRYPAGILDGAAELTVSLSYQWNGAESPSARSQRLFDFSRKASSVAAPSAFIFLETGNGVSGLRFGLSDGMRTTYLPCDYSAVGTWTRVTVTVANGKITLYLNDKVAATGYTDVSVGQICPNFCYVGKSGVKGDPLFRGMVDEIYISSVALPADRVGRYLQGIDVALNGTPEEQADPWGKIIIVIIIAAAVVVFGVVGVLIAVATRKDKQRKAVRPSAPARRSAAPAAPRKTADQGETSSFRPVRTDSSSTDQS